MEELTRRNIRYICFRLKSEMLGESEAVGDGIMEHVLEVKEHMESQDKFGGWDKFGITWDVDEISFLVVVALTKSLESEWNNVFPNAELNWSFLDEVIRLQYENEARINRLVSTATIMSIVIAMLGLVGLIILIINSKVREIGIRKVLGAGTLTLFKLLYRNFGIQVLIALLLSIPITIWLMNRWLQNFAFRVDIGVEIFILSGLIAVLAGSMVIGYHTLRASRINPVESLRTE